MSHSVVRVCLPKGTDPTAVNEALSEALAPFDENKEMEPYRSYEDGSAEDYWWVGAVRRGADHHRNGTGIRPYDKSLWSSETSRRTADEQRREYAKDAQYAELLGEHPTWETVIRLYNEEFHPGDESDDDSGRLYYEAETDRAYTMSTYNPDTYGLVLCPGGQGSKEDQPTWDEVLRALRGHQAPGSVSDSTSQSRRPVFLLHHLYPGSERGADAGATPSLAPLAEISDDTRAVRPALVRAGRQVRDLSAPPDCASDGAVIGAAQTSIDPPAGGSLSSDWGGPRAALLSLQRDAGAIGRPTVVAHCGSDVPHEPHVRANGVIGGSRWDWYQVGGRWRWSLLARQGVDRSALVLTELRGSSNRYAADQWEIEERQKAGLPIGPEYGPNGGLWCDGGPRGLLDFDAMRDHAAAKADAEYDVWDQFWTGLPAEVREPAKPWSHFRTIMQAEGRRGEDAKVLRDAYHAQPWLRAARQHPKLDAVWDCPLDRYGIGREAFVANARADALPGWALLTLDGEWIEAGKMGWWGMSDSTDDSGAAYREAANRYLDELDPEALIVTVDVHI